VEPIQLRVTVVAVLLAAALIIGIIAERIRIPYSVALLIAATPLEVKGLQAHFVSSLLFIFLPALIFEAAWSVDVRLVWKNWPSVLLMAVPGVGLTALLVGLGLSLVHQLPLLQALLLGAILAATDPVAVIPILQRLNVPHELATILEGESLLNDGLAIVLYSSLIAILSLGQRTTALEFTGKALLVSCGGLLIGFVTAGIVAFVLRATKDMRLYFIASIVTVYISYLGAEKVHLSGIFAVVSAGVVLRLATRFPADSDASEIGTLWAAVAFFANTFVFVLMGIRINFGRIWHEPELLLATIAFVTLARLFLSYVAFPLTKRDAPTAWRHVIFLAGMRGAISIALALSIPENVKFRPQIIDATYGVVLITLVAQGIALGPVLTKLRPSLVPAHA
jgi:monovalent cation:H+ antiporter, CPA1 family